MTPTSREALRRAVEAATDQPRIVIYDDTDSKWHLDGDWEKLTEADVELAALCDPQTIIGLLDEVERLEGNQRTPGTYEVCGKCHIAIENMKSDYQNCQRAGFDENCPGFNKRKEITNAD